MAEVDEPTQDFLPWILKEVGEKKHQFLWQHAQHERFSFMTIFLKGLIVLDANELSDFSRQARLQGPQKFKFDEFNSTRLIKPVRNLHSTALRVELSVVTSRENDVIV